MTLHSWQEADTYPILKDIQQTGDSLVLTLWVGASLFQFQGHFPSRPILPGVAQLDWAVRYAQQHFDIQAHPKQITQLKFRNVLVPDQTVELVLTHLPEKYMTKFTYRGDEVVFSSGNLKWDG